MKANLRSFSLNYVSHDDQVSEIVVWKANSKSLIVNVDFIYEGMKWAAVST